MNNEEIVNKVTEEFSETYSHFKDFQGKEEYRQYWDLCIKAVENEKLFSNIQFCNDIFQIPPVKTFLFVHRDELIEITGDPKASLKDKPFLKRCIGAFWGMVFKFCLGYTGQESVHIASDYFGVRSATYYIKD